MTVEPCRSRRMGCWSAVAVALAAGTLALTSGCAGTRPPAQPAGPHFSVMSYNVNWGMPRPDLAVRAILEAEPDIVCLQETTPDWRWYLTTALGKRYPHVAFRHYGGAGGQAFLSKLPFETRAYVKPEAGWFPAWIVTVRTPLGPVQICNLHLRPSLSETGSVSPSAYFDTKDIRLGEVRGAWERLDPGAPALVLGDFNEDDDGRAVGWLKGKGFIDAVSQFDTEAPTWRWRLGLVTLRDRLDHILHSPGLRAASARVVEEGASDHYPVTAVIERAPQRRSPEPRH